LILCDNCGFYVPDEPASNFKGEFGLTCPQCEIIWQSKEDYLEEKKRFSEIFRKHNPINKIEKNDQFVGMIFDPEIMDKIIEEFLGAQK